VLSSVAAMTYAASLPSMCAMSEARSNSMTSSEASRASRSPSG